MMRLWKRLSRYIKSKDITLIFIFLGLIVSGIFSSGLCAEQPAKPPQQSKHLDFIPVYPDSVQVDYRITPEGIQASYMTSGGIEIVKQFYYKNMSEQGWKLLEEKDISQEEYSFPQNNIDCEECSKNSSDDEAEPTIKIRGVSLEFRQEDKTYSVYISQIKELAHIKVSDLTSLGLGDTIITVVYNYKDEQAEK